MSIVQFPHAPQVGDIIGAFLPTFLQRGAPGNDLRLCIVLGLEVDDAKHKLEGLYLMRLSERTDKVRGWDYYLPQHELDMENDPRLQRDYVVRTPRIDLLPATPDYVGYLPVLGHLKAVAWDGLMRQTHRGQNSHFCDNDYGPRGKLSHTVVKTSLFAEDCLSDFDVETVMDHVSLPALAPHHIAQEDVFGLALRQQKLQEREVSRLIGHDFAAAKRNGSTDFELYLQEVLGPRIMAIRSGQSAAPVPAPR